MSDRTRAAAAGILVSVALFTACAPTSPPAPSTAAPSAPVLTSTPTPTAAATRWTPSGEPEVLASDLRAPWSVVPLAGGGALISQRDDGRVRELTAEGDVRDVGTVPGVDAGGEGGLLGLAMLDGPDSSWLYAYFTAAQDNRVVRMRLTGETGEHALGAPELVIDGIAKAGNHNGGRLAFGPDGLLYVTTGDAGDRDAAQDPESLSGKILRLTPEGDAATGNPFGNEVFTRGHRNVQGVAWTSDGTMWASEFGQDTWDELNLIRPGENYGWPIVEGVGEADGFTDPVAQWRTSEASPSGLAAVGATLFVAGLGGERLWVVDTDAGRVTGEPRAALEDHGRLRDAVAAPDGSLWVLTNNTDGRGDPRDGDDVLLRVPLRQAP